MRSFEAWKRKQLRNPEAKAAYDALAEEFAKIQKSIKTACKKHGAKRQQLGRTQIGRGPGRVR
jgi:hypothetical protein